METSKAVRALERVKAELAGWSLIETRMKVVERDGAVLALVASRKGEGRWGLTVLETSTEAALLTAGDPHAPGGVFDNHAHAVAGSFDTWEEVESAASEFEGQWSPGGDRCQCGEIGT